MLIFVNNPEGFYCVSGRGSQNLAPHWLRFSGGRALPGVRKVRQVEGEPKRRWFSVNFFDLIVRFSPYGGPVGFQPTCDEFRKERAVTIGPGQDHVDLLFDPGSD